MPVNRQAGPLLWVVSGASLLFSLAGCGGHTSAAADPGTAVVPALTVSDAPTVPLASALPGAGQPVATDSASPVASVPAVSNRMGAVFSAQATRFSIWSPDSADVSVLLDGTSYPMLAVPDADGASGVYAVTVAGNWKLKPYSFVIDGKTVTDPYSAMVQPGSKVNLVIDPADTAPAGGWAARPPLASRKDAVIYEVHVRDFTIDASSGVPADLRGKYAGMVLAGTTLDGIAGAAKTGIDHLVALGVTHVQLMPLQDFASCGPASAPTCYSWGYDPLNFNVPEERYSTSPDDPAARIREFKTMVNEFHKRGIRVVLDVVYNHTRSRDVFDAITPAYYGPVDLTAVGNTIDARQPMVARMIRDSLEYWAREYNVDGFRFDLMGAFDHAVVASWGQYLETQLPGRTFLLYGEPWVANDSADTEVSRRVRYGTTAAMQAAHIGVFNGGFRDLMKGNTDDGAGGGFIFNSGSGSEVAAALMGSPRPDAGNAPLADLWARQYTSDPEQTINYVDVHDNLCLADKVNAWAGLNGQLDHPGYLQRLQQFALSMVVMAQGIPLLHGGSEIARTKQGDKNSYESPDAINAYRWGWRNEHAATFDYLQKLIRMRAAHPAFRLADWQAVRDHASTTVLDNSLLTMQIDGAAQGDSWGKILLIANSGANRAVALPPGDWRVAVEQSSAEAGNDRVVNDSFTAEGTALSILHQ